MEISELSKLFEALGLKEDESRVLAYLTIFGESTAYAIARALSIQVPKVYEIIERLISQGLVIETSPKPRSFRVSSFLLDEISERIKKLERLKKEMRKIEGIKFAVIRGEKALYKLLHSLLTNVEQRYWAISSFRISKNPLLEIIEELIKKGVDVRFLGPDGPMKEVYLKIGAKVGISKHISTPFRFSIEDNACVVTFPCKEGFVSIFTTEESTVKSFSSWYELLWNTAKKL